MTTTTTPTTSRTRHDDTLTITREVPAVIDFSDILEAARVEYDEDYNPLDCDGLEHETKTPATIAVEAGEYYENDSEGIREALTNARGYFRPDRDPDKVVIIDRQQAARDQWGAGHSKGASKQVIAEMIAANIQSTTDYIRRVYEGDVHGYGVVINYTAPDGEEYHASLWGIGIEGHDPDRDPYIDEVKTDCAGEIAAELEEAGFTVKNQPAGYQYSQLADYKANRATIDAQNWQGDDSRADELRRMKQGRKARRRYNRASNRYASRRAAGYSVQAA